jgi:hypothetical protein
LHYRHGHGLYLTFVCSLATVLAAAVLSSVDLAKLLFKARNVLLQLRLRPQFGLLLRI